MSTGPSLDFWLDTHDEYEGDEQSPSLWDNDFFIYADDEEEEDEFED